MVQDQKRAQLKVKLQLPIVVRELLKGTETLDDAAMYVISDMLCGYAPDQALLACAMAAKEIAAYDSENISDVGLLNMEAERIIECYATRLELGEDDPDLWADTQNNMMHVIAEDLESFTELMTLCQLSFDVTDKMLARLSSIMAAQLHSQLMIVDQVIELLGSVDRATDMPAHAMTGYMADNVVMFPS